MLASTLYICDACIPMYGTYNFVSMTKVKENSTNSLNREVLADCDLTYAVQLMAGRWKLPILLRIYKGYNRFGALKKIIPNITERMLTLQLRELERDGLVTRTIFPEVPPHVEYQLTAIGSDVIPICNQLRLWGAKHKDLSEINRSPCQDDSGGNSESH